MTERPVLRFDNVSKRLGSVQALDRISLTVSAGDFVALLGPNGAGKTTAHSIAVGLRRPDSGDVRLLGGDPRSPASRMSIGVAPQGLGMPLQLKVRELLDLVRAHFRNPYPADVVIERFDLGQVSERLAGGLSAGEARRLAVALAFAGRPKALFLDEPTTGLDPQTRRTVWSVLAGFVKAGGTILMSTHYLDEAETLASRVVVLDRGRVVEEGSVDDITARIGTRRITFTASAPPCLPDEMVLSRNGDHYEVQAVHADVAIRAIAESCDFRDMLVRRASLEEAITWLIKEKG